MAAHGGCAHELPSLTARLLLFHPGVGTLPPAAEEQPCRYSTAAAGL